MTNFQRRSTNKIVELRKGDGTILKSEEDIKKEVSY